jgi:predicted NBD/HSP70 family sugar kinase/biotin operon repressor
MVAKSSASSGRGPRADRNANTQEILSFLRAQGPSTQADIGRATGLSRATVSQIVNALRDRGAVENHWKNGREALVTLASTRGSLASLIVRESAVHAILFDFTAQERFDVDSSGDADSEDGHTTPAMVMTLASRLADLSNARGSPLAGVAIAMEGPVEKSSGAIAPWAWQRLPHWKRIDIAQYFARSLRVPVIVDNDANLAALAEWTWGVGRGCNDFLHITCSEGIGGGMVIDGQIYRGGTGLAGEIGHMVIEEAGALCFCGSRGCLTSFATERAILKALSDSRKPKASLDEVIESARQGDAACQRVLSEAALHLGKALATVVRVTGPSVIAIGGTLGKAQEIVLDGLRSSAEVINLRAIGESPDFRIASIIDHASELGGLAAILSKIDMGLSSLAPWMVTPRPLADAKA